MTRWSIALAFVGLVGSAAAQSLLWSRNGQPCSHWIWGNALVLGDLNGDGHGDFATGVQFHPGCSALRKELWTWSGRDGTQLGTPWVVNYTWSERFVQVLGDVDGDGFKDVCGLISDCNPNCPTFNAIEAHSGRDRRLLWRVQGFWADSWGRSMLGDIDTNGDGVPDLVVSAYRANNSAGTVYVYDGRTGTEIRRVNGAPGMTTFLGTSLASVGDLDSDGCQDYLVGCAYLQAVQADAVVAVSGRTGVTLRVGTGDATIAQVHKSVTGCGDLDRDGVPDFAGGGDGGVIAYSGATGAVLHRLRPYSGVSDLGKVVRGGLDLDQDGIPDLVAAAEQEGLGGAGGVGRVYAFSGRDGSVLWLVRPVDNYKNSLGTWDSVHLLAPQPGNPFPVVVIEESAHLWGNCCCCPQVGGLFRVMRSSPPGVDAFGAACSSAGGQLARIGIRTVPIGVRMTVADGPSAGIGVLLLGTSRTQFGGIPLPIALDLIGLRGCLLQTSIDVALPLALGQGRMDRGYAAIDLPTTLGAGSANVFAQWFVLGGSPVAPSGVTQALALAVR